jgi:glucose-6-phosphate 1-dehydrogenase
LLTQIVIFGASGDLTARKLIPALVGGALEGALPRPIQVIGVSRREKTDGQWRQELGQWLDDQQASAWGAFSKDVHYAAADALDPEDMGRLGRRLDKLAGGRALAGRLYYLALGPSLFAPVVRRLHGAGLLEEGANSWRRVVVEKPVGTDLESARALNRERTGSSGSITTWARRPSRTSSPSASRTPSSSPSGTASTSRAWRSPWPRR